MDHFCHGGQWDGWCGEVVEMRARMSNGDADGRDGEGSSMSVALFFVYVCMFGVDVEIVGLGLIL